MVPTIVDLKLFPNPTDGSVSFKLKRFEGRSSGTTMMRGKTRSGIVAIDDGMLKLFVEDKKKHSNDSLTRRGRSSSLKSSLLSSTNSRSSKNNNKISEQIYHLSTLINIKISHRLFCEKMIFRCR